MVKMVNLTLMVKLTGLKYAHIDCTDTETRFGPILQKRLSRTRNLDKQADTAAFDCGQSPLLLAVAGVVVDGKYINPENLYTHCGFTPLDSANRHLFLSMQVIDKLI
jgi:hypothetical protein